MSTLIAPRDRATLCCGYRQKVFLRPLTRWLEHALGNERMV